jgi:very-short-patch-repair endonuclease
LKLVVEIDGTYWHSSARKQTQDKRKDTFMQSKGYTMLRVKEKDINEDLAREVSKVKEMWEHAKAAI